MLPPRASPMNKTSSLCLAVLFGAIVGAMCLWLGMRLATRSAVLISIPPAPAVERVEAAHDFPRAIEPPPVTNPTSASDSRLSIRIENTFTKIAIGSEVKDMPPLPSEAAAPVSLRRDDFLAVQTVAIRPGNSPVPSSRIPTAPVAPSDDAFVDALSYALEAA